MNRWMLLTAVAALTLSCQDQKSQQEKQKPTAPAAEQRQETPEKAVSAPTPEKEADIQAPQPQDATPQSPQQVETSPEPVAVKKAEPKPQLPPEVELKQELPFKHLALETVRQRREHFSPVHIQWNRGLLTPEETQMVKLLVEAAGVLDEIFWEQTSPSSIPWRTKLEELAPTHPDAAELLHFLKINYGPYDRLEDMEPFLGTSPKPAGANYYPKGLSREEMEAWMEAHPEEADAFRSNFTVIRRKGADLVAIPYSVAYADKLQKAHDLLKQAAALTDNESLKKYLNSRADAFLSNDYFQSDMDWVDLDSKIEVTIGPYEVYEDALFGYKAAFEAFITLKDPIESEKLLTFNQWISKLEEHLPIPTEYKNFKRGASSPMFVVDVIYTAGDTRAGIQTIAFNLPNDERVREQKGSKKVMLRNVGEAKFKQILTPIAARVLVPELQAFLHPEAYSNHTLLHEISHGLGPGTITVDGKETTVNLSLKELYPHLEEAKADTLGLYNALYLLDQGVVKLAEMADGTPVPDRFLDKDTARKVIATTFLAGIFRSTRFGVEEAHGKANLLIFNYLKSAGAFAYTESGQVTFVDELLLPTVEKLANELLMIQALGDYQAGKAFIEKYGDVSEEMKASFTTLEDLPVDIEPIFDLP